MEWGSALSKKIGPLPAWTWGLVAGGGYVLYRLWSGKGWGTTTATDAATEDTSSGQYSGTGADSSLNIEGGSSSTDATTYVPLSDVLSTITGLETQNKKLALSRQRLLTSARNWKLYASRLKKQLRRSKNPKNAKRQPNKPPKTKRVAHTPLVAKVAKQQQLTYTNPKNRHQASRSIMHNRTARKG